MTIGFASSAEQWECTVTWPANPDAQRPDHELCHHLRQFVKDEQTRRAKTNMIDTIIIAHNILSLTSQTQIYPLPTFVPQQLQPLFSSFSCLVISFISSFRRSTAPNIPSRSIESPAFCTPSCNQVPRVQKEWLLCHEVSSERLREEMAHWVVWLSNDSPLFAAYHAINSAQMLTADKKPGVHPLVCGEIWMRLWADCLNTETKVGATTACGNVNLCAGLRAGIEGNLHAVWAVWPQSAGCECDDEEVTMALQYPVITSR